MFSIMASRKNETIKVCAFFCQSVTKPLDPGYRLISLHEGFWMLNNMSKNLPYFNGWDDLFSVLFEYIILPFSSMNTKVSESTSLSKKTQPSKALKNLPTLTLAEQSRY